MAVAVAFVAAVIAGCSHSSGSSAPSSSVISQRYHAAIDPADAGITAIVQRALSYVSGSRTNLEAAVPPTMSTLKKAVPQLNGIAAPPPLHGDILDVSHAMDAVISDLAALEADRSGNVQPDIASLVADSGRVTAAENVVGLALTILTSPATQPPATSPLPTAPTTTQPPATSPLPTAPTTTY